MSEQSQHIHEISLRERFSRAGRDTSGLREWKRTAYSSVFVAIFVFLVQAWLYRDLEGAANDFWVAAIAFVASLVMLPVIELVANFIKAPLRILKDENDALLEKNREQEQLISQLQTRLSPKLTVKTFRITPTPTLSAGPCVYVQLLPECLTDSVVDNCESHLLQIEKWREGENSWQTVFDEPLPLPWSIYDAYSPKSLKPGVNQRINIFWILRNAPRFQLCTVPTPLRATNIFNETDVFKFDVKITTKDCQPVEVSLQAKWGKDWDKPLVALANDSKAPPVFDSQG